MGVINSISPETRKSIAQLLEAGVAQRDVARQLGVARHTVRRIANGGGAGDDPKCGYVCAYTRPPDEDVAARLAEIPADTRDLSAMLLGDPVPARSALARRQERRIGALSPTRSMMWNMRGERGA